MERSIKPSDRPDPDASLVTRIGQRDEAALSQLMSLHMDKIHAAAFRMLGDRAKAEDITQIVFLKLWETAPKWELGRGRVLTYLYRLTTHRCLDILRKRKESLPGVLPDVIDTQPNAYDHIAQAEQSLKIERALNKLSDRQRAALVLFYYQHQSLKDASKIMDITPNAFESLLRRARQTLKPILSEEKIETYL